MRCYDQQHRFYCGIDLHARTLALCILDADGTIVLRGTVAASPKAVRGALAPFREGLVVACECTSAWYWLADLCQEDKVPFVLGHALSRKAIHGGKAKNDAIDAEKSARLLRGGNLPVAYVSPKAMRATRDLLRRRTFLVRKRAELLAHLVNTNSRYNLPPSTEELADAANRQERDVASRFSDPSVRGSAEADLALLGASGEQIRSVELYLSKAAKVHDPQTCQRLLSVPGVGKVLALVPLYEIHDIRRFPSAGQSLSDARLVRCAHESAGEKQGTGGNEIGNAHLRWAFSEATCLLLRESEPAERWLARREKERGQARALGALAARLGRAVYHVLRRKEAFDVTRSFAS
jgi:transposase